MRIELARVSEIPHETDDKVRWIYEEYEKSKESDDGEEYGKPRVLERPLIKREN